MRFKFRNKYFFKLFGFIFCVSFITISSILYSIYYFYATNRAETRQSFITDSLSVSERRFSTLLGEVDMLYALSWPNELVQKFIQNPVLSGETRQQLDGYLHTIRTLNSHVESIALYKSQGEEYLYSGPDFVDMRPFLRVCLENSPQGILNSLSKNKNIFRYTSLPPAETIEGDFTREVIGIMYYSIDTSRGKFDCVVINLNSRKVAEQIFSDINDTALLLNEYGTIISANRQNPVPPLLNRVRWSQKLTAGTHPAGNFSDILDNETKLVTYYKLSNIPWILYQIADDFRFHPVNPKMRLFLIPIIMTALLFSLTITGLASSRLYRPVKRIVSRLDEANPEAGRQPPQKGDEFAFVNAMLTNLSNRIATLEMENTTYLTREKTAYLRNIITGEAGRENASKDWYQYDIEIKPENLFVSIVKWDENEQAFMNEAAFESLIKESAGRCLDEDYSLEIVAIPKNEIILLLTPRRPEEKTGREIPADLERFQKSVRRYSSIPVSVTLATGGLAEGFDGCARCYKNAQELLKQRFVLGFGRFLTPENTETALSRGLNYPGELINELELNIRDGDKERFMLNYGKLLDILGAYIYQEVVSVLLQVITRCLHAMNSISLDNIPIKVDIEEFNQIFSTMHTLEHTRGWFSRVFDVYLDAVQKLKQLTDDKHYLLSRQLQEYIKEHYADPNLNVDQLADIFGYTANHISKIYKTLTGQYLHNYIKNIRIQEAKNLLRETKHSIHEISEMTGFSNYNYFFSSFKKEIGLTPTVYRYRFVTADVKQKPHGNEKNP